ncbi:MAG: hypothetical protein ACT4PM_01700 [Gemmatimonadales bacterium]
MACESNRFSMRMILWAVASAVLTILVAGLQEAGIIPPPLRIVAALAPVALMVGFFVGMGRYLRSMDELQRLIHLEALLFQFAATMLLVMAYAALAKADVIPNLSASRVMSFVWTGAFLLWGLGMVVVRRRYQ